MSELSSFFQNLSNTFVVFIGCVSFFLIVSIVWIAIKDRFQEKHSLRRNYPVLARFRWLFEYLGHFFHYYMVSSDREDKPFNKVERTYAYKGAKGNNRNEAFGSTLDLKDMDFAFVNSQFPYSGEQKSPNEIVYGKRTKNPYTSGSRINISAMSYGALSDVAVLSLSQGAKMGGFLMNTGEGGLSKFHINGGADIIYQIGTAKYGCSNEELTLNPERLKKLAVNTQIKMFEVKLSQGAKPGKGGILPKNKVTKEIAEARGIPVGEASISPNAHKEIKNVNDLVEFISKVKIITEKPVGFKLCLGSVNQFDEIINAFKTKIMELEDKGENADHYYPDFITIDSADGGTGAAPLAHMDNMGMTLKEVLPSISQILNKYNLKNDIKIIASGKLITPSSAGWAFAQGADAINIGRGFLFSLGCIQARLCNKNKCPTGIATHKKKYTKGLVPENKSVRVMQYHKHLTEDIMSIAHSCGVSSFDLLTKQHIRNVKIDINNIH